MLPTSEEPPAPPRVRIAVPSWFHAVPTHRDPDERRAALFALAARVLPEGGPDAHRALAMLCDRQAVELSRKPVLYHGFSYLVADGRASMSSLLAALEPGDRLDADLAAKRIAARYEREAGRYRVERRLLPCGPAVVVVAGFSAPVPTRFGGRPEPAVVPVAYAQAVVPVPDVPYLLVLRLTTPSLADWAEYCQVMVSVLRSIRFERPGPAPLAGPDSARGSALVGLGQPVAAAGQQLEPGDAGDRQP
ncbi:hypothetical protein AB0J86_09945 [Micromonospora sp. NPDC049559]|uniref:hypothetical protein n=1 Tax=Micromonospora sp. NPDC049559 TaxID=3155923 RepID=UPI00342CF18D